MTASAADSTASASPSPSQDISRSAGSVPDAQATRGARCDTTCDATKVTSIWLWPLLVLLVALGIRVVYLMQLRHTPMANLLLGDAAGYDEWARQIAGGDWLSKAHGTFDRAPLYPYFLGLVYALTDYSTLAVRVVQAIIGGVGCVALYAAGRLFFTERVGRVAGMALALYPPAIYFDGLLQEQGLALAGLCVLLALFARAWRHGALWIWAVLGVALGTLQILRENSVVLAPIALLAIWLTPTRGTVRDRALRMAGLLAGLALVLLPVAMRQQAVGGQFRLTNSNFGENLWYGNHPGADGLFQPPSGSRDTSPALPADALSSATGAHALAFVRDQPLAWLALTWRKTWLLFNRVEIGDTTSQYQYATEAWILRPTSWVLNVGVLAPLAALGLALTWGRRRDLWPLHAMLVGLAASTILFVIYDRYRLCIIPLLVLFAAIAVVRAREWSAPVPGTGRRGLALCCLGLAVAVFANWPSVSRDDLVAYASFNIGVKLADQQDFIGAATYYEKAIAIQPTHPDANTNLAFLLERNSRPEAALTHFRAAVEGSPRNAVPQSNLAAALIRQGDLKNAEKVARDAVTLNPALPSAHFNLGLAQLRQGFYAQSKSEFESALELRAAEWPDAHNELGNAYLGMDQIDNALAQFNLALNLRPRDTVALNNLGTAYAKAGRIDDATASFRQALDIDPNMPEAHKNFGSVLVASGNLIDAMRHYQAAIVARPDYAEAFAGLGWVLFKRGDLDGAIDAYQKAFTLNPADTEVGVNLVKLKRRRGDPDVAPQRSAPQPPPSGVQIIQ